MCDRLIFAFKMFIWIASYGIRILVYVSGSVELNFKYCKDVKLDLI
jgi:hypothetical protein